MSSNDWNPDLYLKFGKERIQPSIDLVSRIDFPEAKKIIDVGCGPGNSTQILKNKWPHAEIIGADKSPAMIKKAMEDYPNQEWILLDISKETLNEKFDVVFSNATIQWIPDHENLMRRFAEMLNDHGVLAVQLPLIFGMPAGKAISEIAKKNWPDAAEGVDELFTIHTAEYYYDCLANYFSGIDIWSTDYYHVMTSPESILKMLRSTRLKPYLERLNGDDAKKEFETRVLERIRQDYPAQQNGNVLFPFRRLFVTAKK